MQSKTLTGVALHAEYQHIAGKRGLISSYDDWWVTRLIAKFPGHSLILEEKSHTSAADAKARYNHLRQALGLA
jgi:hypothetical protein